MKFSSYLYLFVLAVFVLCFKSARAQDGCCGLGSIVGSLVQSGISGGYGFQQYSAEGWNHYVDVYNQNRSETLTKTMDEFGTATGFRLTANLLAIQVDDILMDLKISYQWMQEKNEATAEIPNSGTAKREFELSLGTFGTGIGIAYVMSKHFDITIMDLMVTWTSAKLINRYVEPGQPAEEEVLINPENSIGFSLATGIVFYPLPPYLSLEVNGGYHLFSVSEMEFEDTGVRLQVDENTSEVMDNFIDTGGFFVFAQLNFAVPF